MRGFLTAIRTLTILSVPGRESEKFSSALPWFPFVGMILGGILYGIGALWRMLPGAEWPFGGGALLLVASVFLTRGLHLDGLADWADAVGACKGRPERLAIMKDPRLGTFGVVALILLLLTKWTGLTRVLSSDALIWVVPVWVIARDMMVELATTLPYARPGEGTARPFMEGASFQHRLRSHCFTLIVCLFFGPAGAILLALGWGVTGLLKASFKNFFGGITGDLLGTTNELVETVLLVICAIPGECILDMTGWQWL